MDVVAWGHSIFGGNSSNMQTALIGVDIIYSTATAVAAVLKDGTTVKWGNEGCDSRI